MLAASAAISAFSGVVTDPLQRRLGLHQRRLIRLLDTLEAGFLGADARLAVREQYAVRLLDVLDALAALRRPYPGGLVRERPILILFALTLVAIGGLYFANIRFPISTDAAIQRELRHDASTQKLDTEIRDALAKDDVETADMYAQIAAYMHRPLSPEVQQKLADAHSTMATVTRNTKDFATRLCHRRGHQHGGPRRRGHLRLHRRRRCARHRHRRQEDGGRRRLQQAGAGPIAGRSGGDRGNGGDRRRRRRRQGRRFRAQGGQARRHADGRFRPAANAHCRRRGEFPRSGPHRQDHRPHRYPRDRTRLLRLCTRDQDRRDRARRPPHRHDRRKCRARPKPCA